MPKKTTKRFSDESTNAARSLIEDSGDAFYMLLAQRGISRTTAAKQIGVAESRLSSICKGRNLTLTTLANYADALGGHVIISIEPDK